MILEKEISTKNAIDLLKGLIQIPSFSKEEDQTADLIASWLEDRDINIHRADNNVWAVNKYFDATKPTILLNSHHDTVRPNKAYTRNPFAATIANGTLYGLGSNDAGASLVSLLTVFFLFYNKKNLQYNLVMAATAEEENSGKLGLESILKKLPPIDFAIVGEPTEMNLAIAEKGLLVIDGYATGISGHAAHENTQNAIYQALEDIEWIRNYQFPKISNVLGKVKMSVTKINAGGQHNVVPAECHFVIDVRINECYDNKEIFDFLQQQTKSKLVARSFRLNSSGIPIDHPIVRAGVLLGKKTYGSPTLSDQAILTCPSLKMGPGISTRSHQADEFILLSEIEDGIKTYIQLLEKILL